ncbi:2,3-bisphosphoglycerate-dependent phosphoglycerate mutase [Mumia flava]|uniref:2,3-bisphosphoglycerate-dependent phosphoglycerate mutase n=1 Tax=Mumia flava TaxID=1348852 RepID=A0A0B2B8P1_9ACTN|nr:MSMEG_4193 family putative phosphomutase [Mumia flava]PJJ53513.1 2,3-bisphosphoglycerate-dependent phosphoglycerate mutase [Mumia flava]
MPTLFLVRHGRTAANTAGVLAGRSRGVGLDPTGERQAQQAATRLAAVDLALVAASPLQRTMQTARAVVAAQKGDPTLRREPGLVECGYGRWTGRKLTDLAKEPLWSQVQEQPSAVTFPGGESMPAMAARAVETVRRTDRALTRRHGDDALWAAVSHGDVIKAVLADALGMHLDAFQRIAVAPGSVSVVAYGLRRPTVLLMNDSGSDLAPFGRRADASGTDGPRSGDAPVGGGA